MSKSHIADEFQLNRFKVARLPDVARTSGLVRIEIGYAGLLDGGWPPRCRTPAS